MPVNHCNRSSNKYLIHEFSSLDNIEPGLFDNQRPPRSRPSPQPSRPPPPPPPGLAKINWPITRAKKPKPQAGSLAQFPHHDRIPSQLAQSVNKNKNKSKGQRKKN
ncbi:unnamed protein product [Rotaria magnacalcarata]|uniref:Uncharacterized protein n=1 Tax=Rotaria magnacalcarata TaxID=392030 RepID=A0A815STW4_9BILA|nr:unnamed protein product [Rotaria magnacalcarata]CAF3950797.1 unnamed protein product [Rotaria magnacalcarata]CAF5054183.1 unnamed protein product [Rotaria magnacalcarata]